MQSNDISNIEEAKTIEIPAEPTPEEIIDPSIEIFNKKVDNLAKFLKDKNSPIADRKYAEIIIRESEANGADYRINVGIMMAESGVCRNPYKKYNCFGYMNKVNYTDFEAALTDIVPKVSKKYSSRFGWNLTGMAKAYGVHNPESWVKNVKYVTNRLEE